MLETVVEQKDIRAGTFLPFGARFGTGRRRYRRARSVTQEDLRFIAGDCDELMRRPQRSVRGVRGCRGRKPRVRIAGCSPGVSAFGQKAHHWASFPPRPYRCRRC